MVRSSINQYSVNWQSTLSVQDVAKKTLGFCDMHVANGDIFWTESRPWEQGRSIVVRAKGLISQNREYTAKFEMIDETSNNMSVAAGVHGYGGGAFIVKDYTLYFYDSISKHIYKKKVGETNTQQITKLDTFSFADFSIDNEHEYIYGLRLRADTNLKFPCTEIVRVHIDTGIQEVLFSGADFYSNIRISPDGTELLFLQWNYPNMPWDECELWVAKINTKKQINNLTKAYHKKSVSLYQPEWTEENKIYCATDSGGYWNISEIAAGCEKVVFQYPADFGRPLWTAGTRTYYFISKNKIIATACEKGVWKSFLIDVEKKTHSLIENGLTCYTNMAADQNIIAYIAGNLDLPLSVVVSSEKKLDEIKILKNSQNSFGIDIEKAFHFHEKIRMDPAVKPRDDEKVKPRDDEKVKPRDGKIGKIQQIEFISENKKVYAFYYPPEGSQRLENSPCIIKIHGGPTSNADFIYNPKIKYYTSRGFAYVELNYSGSSGYGREYRNRLNKMWGVLDVQDCIACANYLIENKLVDKNNLFISGGSAGGFTVLNTLSKTNLFRCASCYYGISNLIDLAHQIHKFEACYDQNLIGDTIQNNPDIYKTRSPIYHVDNITTPTIFFHGDKDPVVHVNQTLQMAKAFKNKNIKHEVMIFEGEGHGFRKEETIVKAIESEFNFFLSYGFH